MEQINLNSLTLQSQKIVNLLGFGIHTSLKHGSGLEFSEIREYETGDDIRHIDPVQSAKHQKTMIKLYQEQSNLDIIIVVLGSGSMYFGTDEFKSEKSALIASCFARLAYTNSDTFSSFIAEETLRQITKRSRKKENIQFMGDFLLKYNYINKKISLAPCLNTLGQIATKESVIVLIGDFLEYDIDLSPLAKYDVRVCIIRDRFEENPEISGNINLIDNITSEYFYANVSHPQTQNYTDKLKELDLKLQHHLSNLGFRYAKFYTNESILLPLKEVIK